MAKVLAAWWGFALLGRPGLSGALNCTLAAGLTAVLANSNMAFCALVAGILVKDGLLILAVGLVKCLAGGFGTKQKGECSWPPFAACFPAAVFASAGSACRPLRAL